MLVPSYRKRALRRACAALAAAALLVPVSQAGATTPDVAYRTPVAKGSATARAAISASKLRSGLAAQLRRSGGSGGAWVGDPVTGETLFAGGAARPLRLASNMKLFTTATALSRIGPDEQFETRLIADGDVSDGVVRGNLILVGGGDPSLTSQGLARLAGQVRAAGIQRVKGRVLYDESIFDSKRAISQPGISGGRFAELGRLSGLSFESGRSVHPARSAALSLIAILRKRGVTMSKKTGAGTAPEVPSAEQEIGEATSSSLALLSRATNVFSLNFYAEMLVKLIGVAERERGSTKAGIAEIKEFSQEAGAPLRAVNGSGLSRTDIATPRAVGALLTHMLEEEEEKVRDAFLGSLAVAGGSGTLAGRMRGSAAQGKCIGKTGTLTGVSALSGYCEVTPDRFVVFSILMNRVDIGRAHVAQDRMTALLARYRP